MKSTTVTSFRKKVTDVFDVPGARVSVQNAQLLTSTGSCTLDFFLGGGIAVGTICMIEEDTFSSYSDLILKYFLAEGVAWNHSLFLACGEKDPKIFLKELPAMKAPVVSTSDSGSAVEKSSNDLKIAWRYQNKKETARVESHNIGFDLSKTVPEEILRQCFLSTWNPCDINCNKPINQPHNVLAMPYNDLYQSIKREIASKEFKTSAKTVSNILRIGIKSISSPVWQCTPEEHHYLGLIRFLYALKALLRTSFAVAVVTVPSFLHANADLLSKIHQICDTVINLESFVGSYKKSNPLYKDFDGLLHIKKLPVLNTFIYPSVVSTDLAFKLKKKGLLIERLHLPPELEDASEDLPSQFGCSSLSRKLDF